MNDKLLKNGLYNAAAGAIRIGLAVLTIPVLIRLIGVEEYGLWTLTSAVVAMVNLAEAGLSTTTTVFVSQDISREDTESLSQTLTITFGAMLILATLAAIALWFGAEDLVNFFPKLENRQHLAAVQALQIAGLVVWTRLLQQVIIGVEQAYQQYAAMNILMTLQSVASNLGLLVVAGLGGNTVGLMQYQAIINLGILVAHIWFGWSLIRDIKLHPVWSREKILVITSYSLMTWLASVGGVLFTQCDRIIIGTLLGTGVLGIYAAITNITMQINTLSALPVQPLLPAISSVMAKQSIDQTIVQSQAKQALQINSLVALGIGSALLTLAPFVLREILTNAPYYDSIVPFRIAIIIYSLYSVNAVGFYVLFGMNAAMDCMTIQLISGVVSLILITIGANTLGLLGAILGNVGYLGVCLLTLLAMKKLHIPISLWSIWLKFPLLWFLTVILANMIVRDQIGFKMLMLGCQTMILIAWFVMAQPTNFQLLRQKLFPKR